jgi:hypothetical protein
LAGEKLVSGVKESRCGFEAESRWGEDKDEELYLHRSCKYERKGLEELDRGGKTLDHFV